MSGGYVIPDPTVIYPWYKGKVRTNLRRERLRCGILPSLDSRNWVSILPGLDDFRSGPPSDVCGSVISNTALAAYTHAVQSPNTTFSSRASPFSNRSRANKEYVKEIEENIIMDHKSVKPTIFEGLQYDIKRSADSTLRSQIEVKKDHSSKTMKSSLSMPSQKLPNSLIGPTDRMEHSSASLLNKKQSSATTKTHVSSAASSGKIRLHKQQNHYLAFLKRINYSTLASPKKKVKKRAVQDFDEKVNIQEVTEEFSSWVKNFGGEDPKYNIDPDKIITLFAMDQDYKPTVNTAINVVEQSIVPAAILQTKLNASKSDIRSPDASRSSTSAMHKTPSKISTQEDDEEEPATKDEPKKFVRYRYGAWYLNVAEWKKLAPGEELEDPEEVEAREEEEANIRTDYLDDALKDLHSIKCFREFIKKNNCKTPHFMKNIPVSEHELPLPIQRTLY